MWCTGSPRTGQLSLVLVLNTGLSLVLVLNTGLSLVNTAPILTSYWLQAPPEPEHEQEPAQDQGEGRGPRHGRHRAARPGQEYEEKIFGELQKNICPPCPCQWHAPTINIDD